MGLLFLVIPVALGVLTLEVIVVYYLTRRFRYRLAVRTWWLALYAELFILVWVPSLKWPLLVNFITAVTHGVGRVAHTWLSSRRHKAEL